MSPKKLLLSLFLVFALSFVFVPFAFSQDDNGLPVQGEGENVSPVVGTGGNASQPGPAPVSPGPTLTNPLGDNNLSVGGLIGRVINSIMGIVGSLALLMFVYGGLVWMTSSGSQEKVKKGKDILLWSAVGLVVIFGAYALTSIIINVVVQ